MMWQLSCIIFVNAVLQCIPQTQTRTGNTWIVDEGLTSGGSGSMSDPVFPYRVLGTDLMESPVQTISLRGVLSRALNLNRIPNETNRQSTLSMDPGSSVFYSEYEGFQPITLSVNDQDSCYIRIKSEFDRSYPRLPRLNPNVSSRNSLSDPVPSRVSQLPTGISPIYLLSETTNPIAYVPYRLENKGAPLRVPFDRETRRLAYPEFPLLLPYTQLSINDSSENRKYVIYIPFQPNSNVFRSRCPAVSVPVIFRKGEFPKYAPYRVILESEQPRRITTVLL